MQKYVKIWKIRRKTIKGSLKSERENTNNMKKELKLNVDKQQDAIKHLKEYWHIDEIEPPRKDKAVCKTSNQPFTWNKIVGKTYSGKVHKAVVKLLWPNV